MMAYPNCNALQCNALQRLRRSYQPISGDRFQSFDVGKERISWRGYGSATIRSPILHICTNLIRLAWAVPTGATAEVLPNIEVICLKNRLAYMRTKISS